TVSSRSSPWGLARCAGRDAPGWACRASRRRRGGAPAMADDRREPSPAPTLLSITARDAVARARLLQPGDHVLVGVSGGPDSVALLHALMLLRSEYALQLTVCHVHHGLRP